MTGPEQVIAALAEALARLSADPALRRRLGQAALLRARQYLWDLQGERTRHVYRRVLAWFARHDAP